MTSVPLFNSQTLLIPKCQVARSFVSRFMGLMGKKGLPPDEAILFPKCNSIHTFFMRFAIDVLYVHDDGTVIQVFEKVSPWRLLLPRKGTRHVIEMQGGRAVELGIAAGQRLRCEGVLG